MNARVRLFARCVKFTLRKIRREKNPVSAKGGGAIAQWPPPLNTPLIVIINIGYIELRLYRSYLGGRPTLNFDITGFDCSSTSDFADVHFPVTVANSISPFGSQMNSLRVI
jgi:hypothetical protein